MYRFLSNFLKPHHFSNSGGSHHHYIEIDASAQSTSESFKTRCLRGKLNECEIESWLQQEVSFANCFDEERSLIQVVFNCSSFRWCGMETSDIVCAS
jgi:hypothetical protein